MVVKSGSTDCKYPKTLFRVGRRKVTGSLPKNKHIMIKKNKWHVRRLETALRVPGRTENK